MVLGIVPFVLGLAGFVGFVVVRMWEARRGARIVETHRASLDATVASLWRTLVVGDPGVMLRHQALALAHALSHRTLASFATLLRTIERPIARISHRMRMMPPKAPTREPSEFLKTITPEKRDDTTSPSV